MALRANLHLTRHKTSLLLFVYLLANAEDSCGSLTVPCALQLTQEFQDLTNMSVLKARAPYCAGIQAGRPSVHAHCPSEGKKAAARGREHGRMTCLGLQLPLAWRRPTPSDLTGHIKSPQRW